MIYQRYFFQSNTLLWVDTISVKKISVSGSDFQIFVLLRKQNRESLDKKEMLFLQFCSLLDTFSFVFVVGANILVLQLKSSSSTKLQSKRFMVIFMCIFLQLYPLITKSQDLHKQHRMNIGPSNRLFSIVAKRWH